MDVHEVWQAWFAGRLGLEEMAGLGWGRMLGTPSQHYWPPEKAHGLAQWIQGRMDSGFSVYISISYYAGHGLLVGVERLMLDLDAKGSVTLDKVFSEGRRLAEHLRSYCEPLVLYTGGRGLHIHAWLPTVIDVSMLSRETPGDIYSELAGLLGITGLGLRSLDYVVIRPTVLSRPPYTKHHGTGNTVTPLDTDFKPIEPESFSLQPYLSHPLPRSLVGQAVSKALARQAARQAKRFLSKKHGYRPRSIPWIEEILRRGLPDGRRRFIFYIASKYLAVTLKMPEDEAVETLLDFAERSEKRPDYRGSSRISRAEAESYVRSALSYGKHPPSLETVRQKDPELYAIITQTIGKQPRFSPGALGKKSLGRQAEWDPSSLGLVGRFLEETGLREFGYDDFKRWLESRHGSLTAEEWSSYSRLLRSLAQRGLLGRKFLVDGEWVDVGPGKLEEPPSRSVKFYVAGEP